MSLKKTQFSLSDLRKEIPPHCFEKSLFWSTYYLVRDLVICLTLVVYSDYFFQVPYVGFFIYSMLLGFFMWSLFVVGHEGGHGIFSKFPVINFLAGTIAHTPLCVPFYGWAVSHRKHHLNHNHIEKDHSWKPYTESEYSNGSYKQWLFRFTPLLMWLYPIYLVHESNFGGSSGNHFNPWSPMFNKGERLRAGFSAVCVVAWVFGLHYVFPFWSVVKLYWVPYLVFVAWLDVVTYLQHTDEKVNYYRNSAWNYVDGALSTIDRTYKHLIDPLDIGYGGIIDDAHHNISDGHVIHHLFFTSIPHYHLKEATKACLPLLGDKYVFDETPVPIAFWKTMSRCHYVDDNDNICKYKQDVGGEKGPSGYIPRFLARVYDKISPAEPGTKRD